MSRSRDTGVSLLNVLVVVAAGAGLVQVMLTSQESAIDHMVHARDASQARALVDAGVASVAVALRRDLLVAPEMDHQNEAWGSAAQAAVTLDFGEYSVTLQDLRGRFDLNALGPAGVTEKRVFASLLTALDLPQTLSSEIGRIIAQHGDLDTPENLLRYGISPADLSRLDPVVTALPERHTLNINAGSEPVLAALFANPAAARSLVARRKAKGFLDRSDLQALGLVMPPLAGFSSDAFNARVTASVGAARMTRSSLILRDRDAGTLAILPGQ